MANRKSAVKKEVNVNKGLEVYEILDLVTDRVIRLKDRKLYEKYLAKDSGRYIKAG